MYYFLADSGGLVYPALDFNLVAGLVTEHKEVVGRWALLLVLADKFIGPVGYRRVNFLGLLQLVDNCKVGATVQCGLV